MPMFEYNCDACGHAFEELVRSAEDAGAVRCPECSAAKVTRRFSAFASPALARTSGMPLGGGCGRCGDPSGPCGAG